MLECLLFAFAPELFGMLTTQIIFTFLTQVTNAKDWTVKHCVQPYTQECCLKLNMRSLKWSLSVKGTNMIEHGPINPPVHELSRAGMAWDGAGRSTGLLKTGANSGSEGLNALVPFFSWQEGEECARGWVIHNSSGLPDAGCVMNACDGGKRVSDDLLSCF